MTAERPKYQDSSEPEQNGGRKTLWRAMIEQMILDACGVNCTELEHQQALSWLFTPNPDFNESCALADLEPDYVRTRARQRVDASPKRVRVERPAKPKPVKLRGKTCTINGVTKRFADWLKESPVLKQTVYYRISCGWSIEEALFAPAKHQRQASPRVGQKPQGSVSDRSSSQAQDSSELEFFQ
ncbi:hypothetical protein [Bradyrhizobium sp. 33ap4]|uniref:hypothetical protein n=1 Tax=Bradyrhizobium sp. 33ap4 TaxID=3061630 RepID=UPI00292FFA77|nr:hypothetical protein [Bradyrhizobium sp. 33ap4]